MTEPSMADRAEALWLQCYDRYIDDIEENRRVSYANCAAPILAALTRAKAEGAAEALEEVAIAMFQAGSKHRPSSDTRKAFDAAEEYLLGNATKLRAEIEKGKNDAKAD